MRAFLVTRGAGSSDSAVQGGSDPQIASRDPYNLRRFTQEQETDHRKALKELGNGRKSSCWSWWIFPTPPFIRNGQHVGSPTNWKYEIKDDDEGLAYLQFSNLRSNYVSVVSVANEQLAAGTPPRKLLGIDVPRFEASTRYFRKLGELAGDEELVAVCARSHALLHPEETAANKTVDATAERKVGRTDAVPAAPGAAAPPAFEREATQASKHQASTLAATQAEAADAVADEEDPNDSTTSTGISRKRALPPDEEPEVADKTSCGE